MHRRDKGLDCSGGTSDTEVLTMNTAVQALVSLLAAVTTMPKCVHAREVDMYMSAGKSLKRCTLAR